MARPAKRNCDYFPHFVDQSRDLYYLETRYGIEGYYFYYRLRELLCKSDELTYRIEFEVDWDYLYKNIAIDKEKVNKMLNASADNGIIDHELWYRAEIIWQDDLASNLTDAWSKRKDGPPNKPVVGVEEKIKTRDGFSDTINPVSNVINTQSKGKNTRMKGKNTKLDKLKDTRPNTKFIEDDSKPMKKSIEAVLKKISDNNDFD